MSGPLPYRRQNATTLADGGFLVDARSLANDLRRALGGEVRFDEGSRALYATDASNYRQVPIGVVLPRDVEDVVRTVELCRRYGAPVLPRGGGTSLAGQTCNVAVVLDFSKYLHGLLALDPDLRQARVLPGIILDDLRNAAEQHHLTFGPDPATHNDCTLGGMIGNNSCGIHSVMAGRTAENIAELEVLTYDGARFRVGPTSDDELARIIEQGGRRGAIYQGLRTLRDRYADRIRERFPQIPRRVSGYGLDQLLPEQGFNVARALVGSEGTCVTVLEATTLLIPSPPKRALVVLGFSDVYAAADHVPDVMAFGPVGLEGIDDRLVGYMRRKGLRAEEVELLPDGRGWLLVEFGGQSQDEANAHGRRLMDRFQRLASSPAMKLFERPEQQHKLWSIRESGLGATAFVPGERDTWTGWEDSAVPPERLGDYLRELRKVLERYGYDCSFYGHFGQGCLHTRIDFELTTRDGIAAYRSFVGEAADLVVHYGGSFSGEHGDGQSRAELLKKMYGPELMQAFQEFKALWDPDWKMNPGKVVDAYRITDNLRLGPDYHPPQLATHFQYPDDRGSFARAALRCVGVGECRRMNGGVMCPSFMVLREEEHSTRGRARALFEMLQGDPVRDGWRDEHVKEALDLCLACKGCKGECPVNVDMATYKAEFMAHYYQTRLRPRSAYTMGLIYWLAGPASLAPGVANSLTHTPVLSRLAKAVAGFAPEREIPAFAGETFRSWFQRQDRPDTGRPGIILWPDTWSNHFVPQRAQAAVEVLEAAGFDVAIPPRSQCCGRPLYDFGMLGLAR